ncbi:MAG: DNA polymerase Y family protein [Rhizobiaceae bacterium]|nr:DNA polymerase Y family protein [Rhizobiaceae bacterium]
MSLPQRILSLWLPRLPTDRILRQRSGRSWRSRRAQAAAPLVVSRRENNTQRIAALDTGAETLGLKPGMGIADARAMHPSIEVVEADPEADRRLLESLADWCDRYTPLVALDGADGLILDITGCSHLFGGERALLDDLLSRLFHQGLEARAGLASTAGAAWAAARFHGSQVVAAGQEAALIEPLPLASLRLERETCAGLESVGLHTAGAVMQVARAPLVRRFGKKVVRRIDQALGHVEEAISPRLPVPAFSVERQLSEPVSLTGDIEKLLLLLAKGLKDDLEQRGKGAERLQLLLFRVDGAVSRITVGASRPLRDPAIIGKLFHERLSALQDDIDAGYGFDLVRLSALEVSGLDAVQSDLVGPQAPSEEDVALFADRVRARLGAESLLRPVPVASHIPEGAVRLAPFAEVPAAGRGSAAVSFVRERPIRLLRHPDPVEMVAPPALNFRWRRAVHHVVRAEGPERIAPEWWRDETATPTRDYFRVEDEDGRRYWLFREIPLPAVERSSRWFIHGLFA